MESSISFIIYYDDEQYLRECMYYLSKLHIPRGYEISVIGVRDEDDLAKAYNEAMQKSDAKYKIYMDAHTFIINDTFLYEILEIFHKDSKVGMLGICGSNTLEEELNRGRMLIWDGDSINEFNQQKEQKQERIGKIGTMLMATQYDVKWEGECEISHCRLMKERGYDTIVPYQKSNWCIYDCGAQGLSETEEAYRFYLRRVEMFHDMECAAEIERFLECNDIDYLEHIKKAENLAYAKSITGYFWEDFLFSGKKRNKYLPMNGNVSIHEKKDMHIMMAFNHKYVIFAAVMLQSLYENNPLCTVCVHIAHKELDEHDRKKLEEQAHAFGNKVFFYEFQKEWLPEGLKITSEWSIEAYFRLYMLEMLPEYVDRVLYLDVDIIINKSIYDFYFMDMQDSDIVACRDFSRVLHEEFTDERKELFSHIKDEEEFVYFNSGVMLVNISKLRGSVCGMDYVKMAEQFQGRLFAPDQDILNLVHWKNTGLVDEFRYDFFNGCLKGLKAEEVNQLVSIIHYAGPKPWASNDMSFHANRIWWEYASRTKI